MCGFKVATLFFAVVYIVEISGVMQSLSRAVFSLIYGKNFKYNGWSIPVISCGKCAVFWALLGYSLYSGMGLIYSLGIASLCSYSSEIITDILKYLKRKIQTKINEQ